MKKTLRPQHSPLRSPLHGPLHNPLKCYRPVWWSLRRLGWHLKSVSRLSASHGQQWKAYELYFCPLRVPSGNQTWLAGNSPTNKGDFLILVAIDGGFAHCQPRQ